MMIMGVDLISPTGTLGVPATQQISYVIVCAITFYFVLKDRMKRIAAKRERRAQFYKMLKSDRLSILGETMCMTV